jgi:DNA-binding transcriptional regulator GbsR (MarR family)
MENHWERLHHLLSDTQNKVDLNIETKKLYNELNMLKDLILSYEKWANTVESVAEEAGEISKQLEQCRVCHFSVVHIADILAVWSPNNIITQWCSS